ncbi:type IV secretion system DNA-binding domain-containing protein [Parvularcula sp. ZS-1/3]|uniref:Type IV secretion system DNA-binding domain-containing protein n=1 Tax=Parvularcula mediterranea TaxID=2732508 RepID=A0A7Y3RNV1_9PROT|nr:type IV secretion system DNA-binding domain-containing protein [Parvularcula mediterranea]NNU17524.1 type IV secretion system DNA-binding domain-containing protein [Parvularcula mediterranea]
MAENTNGPLKTFLRGGQVTLHTLRMFGQVIRFLAGAMISLMLVIAYLGTMANTSPEERHYAMKRYEAHGYRLLRAPLHTELNMLTASGEHRPFPLSVILTNSAVSEHELSFRKTTLRWLMIGGSAGGLGFLLLVGLFVRRGGTLTRTNIKRGASMTDARSLEAEVKAHNNARRREVKALRSAPTYRLAGIPYPLGSEVQHTSISGTIGSGKTQAISALLEQIREAGDRAIVFDLTGGFIGPFYREGTDHILNPLDARSPSWSVFEEAQSKAQFDAIAAAMIPRGMHGDPVWADSARLVFSTAAQLLVGDGKATNEELVRTLLTASLDELGAFFEGTPAAPIISPDSPKMTNSVRMMLSTYLDGLRLLPTEGETFSVTRWIEKDEAGSTLFLSSRADMHETLKPLLTVWMDTAVRALMSRPRDPFRRIWFILDEVAALQSLPSIMDGLARGRQFGAAFVLGLQAQSQLRQIYGIDGAQSLSSVCRTKLILAASDADTAKWYADFLGRQERSQSNENVSFGANTIRDGVMVARQEKTEHLVIPEEILNLRSLEGFLKLPEGFPLAKVGVPLVVREDAAAPFVPRTEDQLLVQRSAVQSPGKRRSHRREEESRDLTDLDPVETRTATTPNQPADEVDRKESDALALRFPGWDIEI